MRGRQTKLWIILFSVLSITLLFSFKSIASEDFDVNVMREFDANSMDEYILDFHSDIKVNLDSSMIVKESITVNSLGYSIVRGIYRDFPTVYTDESNKKHNAGFKVIEVLRDGQVEPYTINEIDDGKRVYIGDSKIRLPKGQYTYTLTYQTNRQIGFYEDFDELYWNVTGNGWQFPIAKVTATVTLPEDISKDKIKISGFTGREGSKDQNYTSAVSENNIIRFETTNPLNLYEGLTIVVGWPKGYVNQPTNTQMLQYFLEDNMKFIILFAGALIVLMYYAIVWSFVGKDPIKGTIIPLYEPPNQLSPAAVRYISKMEFDDITLVAAIINMAVKGYLKIEKDDKKDTKYILTKLSTSANLTSEEEEIANELFKNSNSITLSEKEYKKITRAMKKSEKELKKSYHRKYFFSNSAYHIIGCLLSIIIVVFCIQKSLQLENLVEGLMVSLVIFQTVLISIPAIFFIMLFLYISYVIWTIIFSPDTEDNKNKFIFLAISVTVIAMISFSMVGRSIMELFTRSEGIYVIALSLIVAINFCFYYLIKAPTIQGRKIMDKLEGFKLFLSVSEKERLDYMFPIDKTPELFEKFLPYALALGVEQQWSQKFASELEKITNGENKYRPTWYTGNFINASEITSFTSSFSSAIISSSTSNSRSGFRGGSSGGGRGGGGGGGW